MVSSTDAATSRERIHRRRVGSFQWRAAIERRLGFVGGTIRNQEEVLHVTALVGSVLPRKIHVHKRIKRVD
jgi:hypothetical protein